MNRRLYIVRHAKAAEAEHDHERPLTFSGVERTLELGGFLLRNGCRLDALFASDSLRTRQTAENLAAAVGFPSERIVYDPALYLTTEEAYFNVIVSLDETVHEVMIVGHNPEVSNLIHFFLPDFTSYMQTGACACIGFEAENWQSIFTAPHQLEYYFKA